MERKSYRDYGSKEPAGGSTFPDQMPPQMRISSEVEEEKKVPAVRKQQSSKFSANIQFGLMNFILINKLTFNFTSTCLD